MMNPPPASGNSPEQIARNNHIVAATVDRNKGRDASLPPLATYQALVQVMSHAQAPFKAWQEATKAYNECIAPTGAIGAESSAGQREVKLHEARIARIEYLAPLDMATAQARGPGAPSLLSSEEWDMLACARHARGKDKDGNEKPVSELIGNERAAAVKKFKEETYGQYENLISEDQFGRAGQEVQKSRQTFKRVVSYLGSLVGFREKTEGEKALTKTTKAEAEAEIKAELAESAEVRTAVDTAIKNGATKKREELLRTHVDEEFKKKVSADSAIIDARIAKIDARKAGIREDLEHGKEAYATNVSEITAEMEMSLQALTVFQQDVAQYNKTKESGPDIDVGRHDDDVRKTIAATTLALEKSVLQDYHHFARLYEERFAGAGKMSRYHAFVDAKRSPVSEGQQKVLKDLDENKNKLDKDGKLLEGESLTVNGIPCENVGVVDLYKVDTGFSFFGKAWGGGQRIQQIGKFMEVWMVETTAANQQAYQAANGGKKLTMEQMLQAYASGDKLPNGEPNKNKGPNGPINALRMSAFPVSGGVEATLRAYAEFQAFAHILGIEINVDADMIAQNSTDSNLANRIRIEWISHKRLDDPTYGKPAMEAIEKKYGLEGIKDPVAKRQRLITALAGNDISRAEVGMVGTVADQKAKESLVASGEKPATGAGPDVVHGPQTKAEAEAAVAAAAASTPAVVPPATVTMHTGPGHH